MSDDKQHTPQHEDLLKQQALEQQEVKEVLNFIQKYAKPAGVAIIAACAIVLINGFFQTQRLKKEAQADAALAQASSAQALQAVADDYASTPAAPIALMELAKTKFNSGQVDQAEELYKKFAKKYNDHPLLQQAELNLIMCVEARKQFSDAVQRYSDFGKKHKGSAFIAPQAMLGQARCLEAQNLVEDAKIIYEDIIANYSDSDWSQIADSHLKVLAGKK